MEGGSGFQHRNFGRGDTNIHSLISSQEHECGCVEGGVGACCLFSHLHGNCLMASFHWFPSAGLGRATCQPLDSVLGKIIVSEASAQGKYHYEKKN